MQVTVHYFAQLKKAAGVARETVAIEADWTLARLLKHLAECHGESFRGLVLDASGQPQRTLLLAIGDEQADLNQNLHDEAEVTVLTPMSGGSR
jgi:molybdopterin converting factor small subunit